MLGETDLSFSIVVISNDVSHSVAEGEFGVLLVVLNRIRYLSLDHRCGGIFCELVPLDGPSCLEVEEFLAASPISQSDQDIPGVVRATTVMFRGSGSS